MFYLPHLPLKITYNNGYLSRTNLQCSQTSSFLTATSILGFICSETDIVHEVLIKISLSFPNNRQTDFSESLVDHCSRELGSLYEFASVCLSSWQLPETEQGTDTQKGQEDLCHPPQGVVTESWIASGLDSSFWSVA